MIKYVFIDKYKETKVYPFISNLDLETLLDQLIELNEIAICEDSSVFSYLGLKLNTIYSRYVGESYGIYTLEDWFTEYCINE